MDDHNLTYSDIATTPSELQELKIAGARLRVDEIVSYMRENGADSVGLMILCWSLEDADMPGIYAASCTKEGEQL